MKKRVKWIKVFAQYDCGCCTAEMKFKSLESAEKAFAKAGMGNGMEITDDAGEKHEGIDTFYGFWEEEAKEGAGGLGRLMDVVTGDRSWPDTTKKEEN
jgi:hypothetical protein